MKRSLKWVIGAAALATAQLAQAQVPLSSLPPATDSASGSVNVIDPVTILKNTDLSFGALVRPSIGANTVTVDQGSGARHLTGGGDASLSASAVSRATYTVGGGGGAAFSVTVPRSFNLTRIGGGETVPVSLTASALNGALNGPTGAAGSANFGIGGSLPLSSATVPGNYTGTFDVTVGYN